MWQTPMSTAWCIAKQQLRCPLRVSTSQAALTNRHNTGQQQFVNVRASAHHERKVQTSRDNQKPAYTVASGSARGVVSHSQARLRYYGTPGRRGTSMAPTPCLEEGAKFLYSFIIRGGDSRNGVRGLGERRRASSDGVAVTPFHGQKARDANVINCRRCWVVSLSRSDWAAGQKRFQFFLSRRGTRFEGRITTYTLFCVPPADEPRRIRTHNVSDAATEP